MLYGKMLNGQMLHGQMLHGQMLHGQMVHGQMLHGQMLHGQMLPGYLSTVKDGSTNLKCPPRYFPWGGGGRVRPESTFGNRNRIPDFSSLQSVIHYRNRKF